MTETPSVDPATTKLMQALAAGIDKILNGDGPKNTGFTLLIFPFGEPEGKRTNYVSNADRADMVAALAEVTARFQGRFIEPTKDAAASALNTIRNAKEADHG